MSFAGTSKHTRSFVVPGNVFQEDSSCFAFGTLLDSWKKCAIPTNNLNQRSTRGSWSHPIKLRMITTSYVSSMFYSRCFFTPNKMDTISSNVPTTSIEFTPHGDSTSQRPSKFSGPLVCDVFAMSGSMRPALPCRFLDLVGTWSCLVLAVGMGLSNSIFHDLSMYKWEILGIPQKNHWETCNHLGSSS